jgi:hypothetical protein
LAGALVALRDFLPVDHVPPGVEIVRAPVVVLEIVSVLPEVVAEDRRALDGRVVISGLSWFGVVAIESCPSRSARSQTQPDPNWPTPASPNCFLNASSDPNASSITTASRPTGGLPPGFIVSQKKLWFQ